MSADKSDDKRTLTETDAQYEAVACEEEIYDEETEEKVREVLTNDDPSPSENKGSKSTEITEHEGMI